MNEKKRKKIKFLMKVLGDTYWKADLKQRLKRLQFLIVRDEENKYSIDLQRWYFKKFLGAG